MPASIRKDQKQLEVTIMQAEHLPKMDMIGTIDAYVSAAFQKQKYKTKTVNPSSGVCTFDQVFMIPLQWPATTDRLVLGVWDEERAAADEAVGVVVLSLKEIA
jgi:Ca2+-dependent lipid-binding protein